MKTDFFSGSLAALLLSAGLAAAAPAPTPQAPSFNLPARSGMACLDSLRGHVVLLDFWASWCQPCEKSFPWLGDVHRRYAPGGLKIVAINLDKSRPPAMAFLDAHPAPFTVAFDPAGRTAEAFRVTAMPSTYVIGSDGSVRFSHAGYDAKGAVAIEAAIKEAMTR